MIIPAGVVGFAGYLLITGLQSPIRLRRVIAGSAILIILVLLAGFLSSLIDIMGLGVLLMLVPATFAALIVGLVMIGLLERWRKLTAVLVGIGFPLAAFMSLSVGTKFAPATPTLEEAYLEYTQNIVEDIQDDSANLDGEFSYPPVTHCKQYIQTGLLQNLNQYSLEALMVYPPDISSFGAGSTDATIAIKFPDGNQVELTFHNYILESCTRNGES